MRLEQVPDDFPGVSQLAQPGNHQLPAQAPAVASDAGTKAGGARPVRQSDRARRKPGAGPGRLPLLVYLNLSDNPLRRAFSVFAMTELNALHLSRTRLQEFPYGTLDAPQLHTLDLSGNNVSVLPDDLHQSRGARAGSNCRATCWRQHRRRLPAGIGSRRVACRIGSVIWTWWRQNVAMKWPRCGFIWKPMRYRTTSSRRCPY